MDTRTLKVPEYTVEIWRWGTGYGGQYVADISNIITDGLAINWRLNDVETLDFSIDLVQFEKKCKLMGVTPAEVLTPYVHDVRVRRNGEYILGCQVVETNLDIPNDANTTIQVRCTGFLNLFKDRYLTVPLWCDKSTMDPSYAYRNSIPYTTPAYVAGQLVELSQTSPAPVGIVKNPTCDIDRDGWLAPDGWIEESSSWPYWGNGHLRVSRNGTGWVSGGTRLYVPAGTTLNVTVWLRGQPNTPLCITQRQYINSPPSTRGKGFGYVWVYNRNGSYVGYYDNDEPGYSSNPSRPQVTTTDDYRRYEFTMTTQWDTTYLVFGQNRTNAGYAVWIDELRVSYATEDGRRSFYVSADYPVDYSSTRKTVLKRNYALQNVKDALMELTEIDEDPIEFYFDPDRSMHIGYASSASTNYVPFVGQNKYDLQICYPGNVESMTITRSASNLYNSLQNIGSGIGNERIEAQALDTNSIITYGCREAVTTSNNASEYSRLYEEAAGALELVKTPTNLPKIVIRDGSVNPNNLKIGDRIHLYINNGDEYLGSVTGAYRVVEYRVEVDLENVETVTLTLEKW